MLTKDQIKKKLKENPEWEPTESASYEEWEAYDIAVEELEKERRKRNGLDEDEDYGGISDDYDEKYSDEDSDEDDWE